MWYLLGKAEWDGGASVEAYGNDHSRNNGLSSTEDGASSRGGSVADARASGSEVEPEPKWAFESESDSGPGSDSGASSGSSSGSDSGQDSSSEADSDTSAGEENRELSSEYSTAGEPGRGVGTPGGA